MLKAFQRTLSSRFKSGGESKEDSSMVISTSDRGGPLGFKLDRPSLNDFEVLYSHIRWKEGGRNDCG
jgi:hypothetical protein